MSDTERVGDGTETILSAEYKDGQLQIVEVTAYEKGDTALAESHDALPDLESEDMGEQQTRFVQVLNSSDKSVMELDLLNMTLVSCDNGANSTTYRLIASDATSDDLTNDGTVTCVLQSSDDPDDVENQDYVVMDGEEGIMLLQSPQDEPAESADEEPQPKKLSALELLERAKALQKVKAGYIQSHLQRGKATRPRGRKRTSDLPPPHEMLTSPNFKLFLYSCKLCSFKCNAIKDLTSHKALEHSAGSRLRSSRPTVPLQCARCPYKGITHTQLMKHVQEKHTAESNVVILEGKRVEEAQVLVCGACGYESASRLVFKKHIQDKHGASTF